MFLCACKQMQKYFTKALLTLNQVNQNKLAEHCVFNEVFNQRATIDRWKVGREKQTWSYCPAFGLRVDDG